MAYKKQTKYSYSRLEKYINCPFSYFLNYVQGNYVDASNIAISFGSLIHRILEEEAEYIKNNEEIPYDDLIAQFTNSDLITCSEKDKGKSQNQLLAIDKIAEQFPEDWINEKTKSGKSYKQKADDFIQKGIYRLPEFMKEHPEYEIVGCEIPFEFDYGKYKFKGSIDRVLKVKGANHYIVHDIKTKDSLFTDTATCLQFVIYCMALQKMYGDDITFECAYDLPVIDTLQPVCTKGFMARGIKKIDNIFAKIEDMDWEPKPSPLCYYCPYRLGGSIADKNCKPLCSYYSLWAPDNKTFDTKLPWEGIENDWKQLQKLQALNKLESEDSDDFDI